MNAIKQTLRCAVCAAVLFTSYFVSAADAKTYQVTGPVTEITPTTITVQKGQEKWQINRDASTKGNADIKVGTKVTVYYTMTATEIEVKAGSKGSSEKK
jgi:hypothetical protein